MKKTIALFLFSLGLTLAMAQEVDLNALHRIKDEGLNHSKLIVLWGQADCRLICVAIHKGTV